MNLHCICMGVCLVMRSFETDSMFLIYAQRLPVIRPRGARGHQLNGDSNDCGLVRTFACIDHGFLKHFNICYDIIFVTVNSNNSNSSIYMHVHHTCVLHAYSH